MAIPPEVEKVLPLVDTTKLDIDNAFEIGSEVMDVEARWKKFGAALGLAPAEINRIEAQERGGDCLTKVLEAFLRMNYDTGRHGLPSWQLIVKAVGHRNGGADTNLALTIAAAHPASGGGGGGGGAGGRGPASISSAPVTTTSGSADAILKKKPDMRKLTMIEYRGEDGDTEIYRLLEEIAPYWRDIADYLKSGPGVIAKCEVPGMTPKNAAREVMSSWLGTDVNASWKKLMKAMKTVPQLAATAKELRTALLNICDEDED